MAGSYVHAYTITLIAHAYTYVFVCVCVRCVDTSCECDRVVYHSVCMHEYIYSLCTN